MDVESSPPTNNGTSFNESRNEQIPLLKSAPISLECSDFGRSDEYGVRLDFTNRSYQDKVWAAVWIGHIFIMLAILSRSYGMEPAETTFSPHASYTVIFMYGALCVAMGCVCVWILRRFSGVLIKLMMWANLASLILSTIIAFQYAIFNGIIMTLLTGLFGLYMRRVWQRIPFATVLIQIASDIIERNQGTLYTALLCLALQLFWVIIWGKTVAILVATGGLADQGFFVVLLLLLSLYWNLEVFKNLCHTTVCGVAAAWYFSPSPPPADSAEAQESSESSKLTKLALKRACTTSLGSVALGSLMVSAVQAMRAMVRHVARYKDRQQCVACVVDCLLGVLERWISFFNSYAYAHVSIYGEGFVTSAKRTWALLESKGIDAWINDDLVGFAIVCGAGIGGFVCVAAGAMFLRYNGGTLYEDDPARAAALAMMGFLVGFYLCWTILNVVGSCVVALFVCYAEDPNAMEVNHQSEYHKLLAARTGVSMTPMDDDEKTPTATDTEMQRTQAGQQKQQQLF